MLTAARGLFFNNLLIHSTKGGQRQGWQRLLRWNKRGWERVEAGRGNT